MKPRLLAAAALLTVLAASLSGPANAQMAFDFQNDYAGGTSNGNNPLGYEFTVTAPILVTDLGIYDEGNDGFANTHQVGIWTVGAVPLTSSVLPAGLTGNPIDSVSGFGAFRFVPITPLLLPAGTYVIAANYANLDADIVRTNGSSAPIAAASVIFNQLRFDVGTAFAFPTQSAGTNGHFGPNFLFRPDGNGGNAAPEPGTLALLALGVVGGIVARRKK